MPKHPAKTSHRTSHTPVARKIRKLKKEGKPQKQAVAIALNRKRKK